MWKGGIRAVTAQIHEFNSPAWHGLHQKIGRIRREAFALAQAFHPPAVSGV
jgi:hypothetical protein